jgi:hypothetical protein
VILAACGLITLTYAIGWRIATRKLSLSDADPAPPATATESDVQPGRTGS